MRDQQESTRKGPWHGREPEMMLFVVGKCFFLIKKTEIQKNPGLNKYFSRKTATGNPMSAYIPITLE